MILGMLGISFIFPLIHLPIRIPVADQAETPFISVDRFLNNEITLPKVEQAKSSELIPVEHTRNSQIWGLLAILYIIGVIVMGRKLYLSLRGLAALIHDSIGVKYKGFFLLEAGESNMPYSFFRFIFVDHQFNGLPEVEQNRILAHERVHTQELHSLDILFLELYQIIFWFNPIILLIKQSLKEVHEYIADEETVQSHDLHAYARLLVQTAGIPTNSTLVNGFAQSLVGKRVKRLLAAKTGSPKHLVLALPTLIGFFLFFACDFQKIPPPSKAVEEPVVIERPLVQVSTPDTTKQLPAIQPVQGKIISGYGMRMHPIHKIRKHHAGIDFEAAIGTPVYATADGTVSVSGITRGGHGVHVEILHPLTGFATRYTHLDRTLVSEGQEVRRGEVIGLSGNSGLSKGPHLHYEVRKMSEKSPDQWKSMNPEDFFYPEMNLEYFSDLKKNGPIPARSPEENEMSMD